MPAEQKTLTSTRAIIKVNGKAIGYLKNFRINESITRVPVTGLGSFEKRENPATGFMGTWSAEFYTIDFGKITDLPGLDNRNAISTEQYKNTITLAEIPIDIYIYKKDNPTVTNGVVTSTDDTIFAVVRDCYLTTRGFDITEGAVSGTNMSGEYLKPIINGL